MPKILTFEIAGIKCDHCDWRDDSVRYEDYDLWLNVPCRKCGSNLLTEADLKTTKWLMRIAWWINFFFGWIGYFKKNDYYGKVEMNGTGVAKVHELTKTDQVNNAFESAREIQEEKSRRVSDALKAASEETNLFKSDRKM